MIATRPRALCWLPAAALVAGLGLGGPAHADRQELEPVPVPNLEAMEPAVRNQLAEARQELDERLADDATSPAVLAAAFGLMGRLAQRYALDDTAALCYRNASLLEPTDPRWPYYAGVIAMDRGALTEATSRFETVLALRPGDLPTLLRLGIVDLDRNDPQRAAARFAAALEVDPGSAKALHGLGQAAALGGDPATALEWFEAALVAQPTATKIHYEIGLAYRELGEVERAREHLGAYGSQGVTFSDPLVEELDTLATGAGIHLVRGNMAFSQRRFDVAARSYRQAIEADPANLRARRALASALASQGDRPGAMAAYREVLARDPDNAIAHYNMGLLDLESGALDAATDHFQRSVAAAPDYSNALFNLANALEQSGRLDDAAEAADRAMAVAPHDPDAQLLAARLALRRHRPLDAISLAETLLAIDPGQAAGWMILGAAHEENGQIDDAIAAYEQAVGLEPAPPDAALRLANLLGRSGRFADAANAFDRVLASGPANESAQFGRAMARLMAQDYPRARADLEAGMRAVPSSVGLRHALARLLATCPDAGVRDGTRALALATEVFRAAPSIDHAETVAMAHAERGEFDEAVQWVDRIIQQARHTGRADRIPHLEARRAGYQRGEPVRAPWLE